MFVTAIKEFFRTDQGASVVETALLIALLVLVCMAAISALGSGLSRVFSGVLAGI
jgi:Flp pilus assembly pilin Flp